MKISVITATFNSERTVARAILSVLSQKDIELEYVIVDGASSDRTLSIIGLLSDSRCRLLSEPDAGIYDALNKGLRLCSGDLVAFLHSDDTYAHDHVLAQVSSALDGDSSALGVYGNLDFFQHDISRRIVRRWRAGKASLLQLYLGWMPPHPTLVLRRVVYERYGVFGTDIGSAADYDFILRVFLREHRHMVYLKTVLVLMQTGGASDSGWRSRIRSLRSDARSWSRNSKLINPLLPLVKPLRKVWQLRGC